MAKPTWTLDQVVDNLNRNGVFWEGDTITYSFLETRPVEYDGGDYSFLSSSFSSFSAAQEAAAKEALSLWDDVIAVSLVEAGAQDAGNIRFANASGFGGAGTFLPGDADGHGGDVWFDSSDSDLNDARKPGDFGFTAFVHEIGHALGLDHPGAYNADTGQAFNYANHAEYQQDSLQYTAMSYFGAFETGADHFGGQGEYLYPSAPLLHDIAAVQEIYGADMSTRITDTVYGFNSSAGRDSFDFTNNPNPVIAIWDAGGIDTLDFSGYASSTTIDLNPGAFSSTAFMSNNVAIAYGAEIENAVGGSGADQITGNSLDNVLEGGAGNDSIIGHFGNDTLLGGEGNDSIDGSWGNDTLLGGAGNDVLEGDVGNDRIEGGDGNDVISGGDQNDLLMGEDGADTIFGGIGYDTLFGGAGNDVIDGGGHHDTIYGGLGDDTLSAFDGLNLFFGGEGDDLITGGVHSDTAFYDGNFSDYEVSRDYTGVLTIKDLNVVDGDEGTDTLTLVRTLKFADQEIDVGSIAIPPAPDLTLHGTAAADVLQGLGSDDTLYGYGADDTLSGGDGADTLYGGFGVDTLNGGDADDILAGGQGADNLHGGAGVDTAVFEGKRGDYWITPQANGLSTVRYQGINAAAYGGIDNVSGDVEYFQFSDGTWLVADLPENVAPPVYLKAPSSGGALAGGGGDDVLVGRGGNDRLYGGDGNDVLNAKGGNNRAYGGEGDDKLFSKGGKDRLYGEAGDDYISAGSGNDKAFGGAGNDTIVGGKGNDKLYGQEGDDTIYGSKNSNKIYGGEGNDTLVGGKQVDKIYGEAGDDTIYGGKGNDKLYGQDGDDYIEGGNNLNKIYGGAGDDTLIGGKHTDKIYGQDGNDTLTGGGGKDTLIGGDGDDVYFTDGRDRIIEYSDQGVDTIVVGQSWGLAANFENLDLTGTANINGSGNSLNNYLWGNEGNNGLFGGAGEDTLDGWLGNDLLVGGDDSDVFLFGLGEDEGEDIILDFNSAEDVLAFDNVIDGAGDDLADIDAQIIEIINEGAGGDVVVSFASGTDVTFDNLGSGTAGTLGSIADLVDDAATQISTASILGLGAGAVLTSDSILIEPVEID